MTIKMFDLKTKNSFIICLWFLNLYYVYCSEDPGMFQISDPEIVIWPVRNNESTSISLACTFQAGTYENCKWVTPEGLNCGQLQNCEAKGVNLRVNDTVCSVTIDLLSTNLDFGGQWECLLLPAVNNQSIFAWKNKSTLIYKVEEKFTPVINQVSMIISSDEKPDQIELVCIGQDPSPINEFQWTLDDDVIKTESINGSGFVSNGSIQQEISSRLFLPISRKHFGSILGCQVTKQDSQGNPLTYFDSNQKERIIEGEVNQTLKFNLNPIVIVTNETAVNATVFIESWPPIIQGTIDLMPENLTSTLEFECFKTSEVCQLVDVEDDDHHHHHEIISEITLEHLNETTSKLVLNFGNRFPDGLTSLNLKVGNEVFLSEEVNIRLPGQDGSNRINSNFDSVSETSTSIISLTIGIVLTLVISITVMFMYLKYRVTISKLFQYGVYRVASTDQDFNPKQQDH